MDEILGWGFLTFSTRELAVIAWSIAIVAFLLTKIDLKRFRKQLFALLQAFLKWKVLFVAGLLICYVTGEIYLLSVANIWSINNLKDTVFWFFGVGFVMLFDVSKAGEEGFFQNKLRSTLQAVIILEFIIGKYTFALLVELILVPIATLITLLHVVADTNTKYQKIGKAFYWMLALMGFILLGYSLTAFVQTFHLSEAREMLKELLLSVLLTIGLLPLVYMLGLLFVYEELFVRLTSLNKQVDKKLIGFAKRKIALTFGFNLFKLTRWSKGKWLRISSKDDILELLVGSQNS